MDWADEIAERIFHEFQASDMLIEPISTALRKARVDGMLEAAARITELEAALKEAREVEEAFLQLHGWITNWETSFDEDTDWIEHVKPEIERVAGKLLSARALASPATADDKIA